MGKKREMEVVTGLSMVISSYFDEIRLRICVMGCIFVG